MPVSKQRQKGRRPSKRRDKAQEARARETHAAQQQAEAKKLTPAAHARRRVLGWSLVALAVVVFLQHLVSHFGVFTLVSEGWDDLIAGYPLAGVLALVGILVLTR